MRLDARLEPRPTSRFPAGTLVWDSDTGELGGTLAETVRREAEGFRADGGVGFGPALQFSYPVHDPLRTPAEMAAILANLRYELPAELARAMPRCDWTAPADDPDIAF